MCLFRKAFFGVNDKNVSFEKLGFPIIDNTHRVNLEYVMRALLRQARYMKTYSPSIFTMPNNKAN